MSVCLYTYMPSAHGGQKWALDPLELEVQPVVSPLT